MKSFCFLFALIAHFSFIDGYKVLGILPFGSNSHFAIGQSIVKTLLKAGHEVTTISPYPQKTPLKNYTDISTADALEKYKEETKFNAFEIGSIHPVVTIPFLYQMGCDLVKTTLEHPAVVKLLESDEKFDVCVIEIFNADAMLGIAERFDCILISFTTFGAVKWINDMTSNQMSSSYVPHPFLHFTDKMSFTQRWMNTFTSLVEDVLYFTIHLPNQRKLYQKYFPNAKKTFDEMYKGSSIIFLNNHVSSASARPYLPNMIEIGGIHVEPPKALPKDIEEFLDSAKDGAILFSMGSIIQSKDWEEHQREALVKAFGKLKQKVLWKYENETLPNKPDNVMISSWIPQRDILAHDNIKLFITHGGLLGTTEALVEGVPILGIPVYGDQRMNMAKAVTREYGLKLSLAEVTESNLSAAINELLSNPKFKKNADLISSRFIDRPMSPKQAVLYWTDYALRHNGAPHLRAAGNSLSFFEFHLIDVYVTFALIGLLFLYIDYVVLKFILRRIFKKKPATDKKLKKK